MLLPSSHDASLGIYHGRPFPPTPFGVPAEKEKKNHISCRGGKPSQACQGRNQPVALSRRSRPGSNVLAPGLWGALVGGDTEPLKSHSRLLDTRRARLAGRKVPRFPRSGFLNTPRGLFARGNRPLSYLLMTHLPARSLPDGGL